MWHPAGKQMSELAPEGKSSFVASSIKLYTQYLL